MRSVTAYPKRSLVVVSILVVTLAPLLVGLGITHGVRHQVEAAIETTSDIVVSGVKLGRPYPLQRSLQQSVKSLPGVAKVVPRIVGSIVIGQSRESAIVVGMPLESLPEDLTFIEGQPFSKSEGHQLVLGTELAKRLELSVGDRIPPFYRNRQGEKVATITGVFRTDAALWQSHLIYTDIDTAAYLLAGEDLVTDLLVECREGYSASVADLIEDQVGRPLRDDGLTLVVTKRDDIAAMLPRGLGHREGIFTLFWMVCFVVAAITIMLTSGVGMDERRQEIAILKSVGWETDRLLFRGLIESCILALAGIALALIAALLWIRWGNGALIAGLFLSGLDAIPSIPIPFQLLPVPLIAALALALAVVLCGTLLSIWRAATTSPGECLR